MCSSDLAGMYTNLSDSLRHASFQVASIMTTTGFSSVDFNLWPEFSKAVLVLLMFIGGCAGSTAGGLKVSRVVILAKSIRCELKQMLHPRAVSVVRFDGKKLDDGTRRGVSTYFALYAFCLAAIFLIISTEPFDFETNMTAVISCFNNIGPGFAGVGPLSSYASYSDFATLVLSFAMLFGRLELYPILILFAPSTWMKK